MARDDPYKENREITYLSNDLGEVMVESDCAKAFDFLEAVLHISNTWRKDFEKTFLQQPRSVTKPEYFIRYTRKHIDPHLMVLLQRRESPVQAMLRFLLRDRLNEKKTENSVNRNYYYHSRQGKNRR